MPYIKRVTTGKVVETKRMYEGKSTICDEIIDNRFESNTEEIKRALRKKVELLAEELLDHPEKTDEDRFKIANAIFDYSAMLLKVYSIDGNLR